MWKYDIDGMMHKSQMPLDIGLANPQNKWYSVANKTALN